jgi:predicted permease
MALDPGVWFLGFQRPLITNLLFTFMNDLKLAFRQLLKNPGFTAVAVLTLALGIGANTAIFSVLDAVLLKMLPVRKPEQLWALNHAGGDRSGNGFAYPVFERLRDQNQAFSDLFAFSTWPESIATIQGREEPLPGSVLLVSGGYHAGLGIRPLLGRLISPEDNRAGHPVAVLSYGFWQRKFGGAPSVIGQSIALNGTPFTVIGVTPPEFFGVRVGRSDAITVPMMMQPLMMPGAPFLQNPKNWDVEVMGRLKPGQTEAQAKAGLRVLFQQIELELAGENPPPDRRRMIQERRIDLAPASQGLSALRRQFSEPLRILMAVAGLVLLIACANVANLLLARAAARRKEIAVRLALGAGRLRLVRQLLTESLLLASLGGAAGFLVAPWVSSLCVALIPDRAGSIDLKFSLDQRLLAFTAIVSILTGIVFGLVPAWQSTRTSLAPTLKNGPRDIHHGPRQFWLGGGLVAIQVALSLLLLVGAGLFVRTFQKLKALDPGFDSGNLLLVSLDSRMRGSSPNQPFNLVQQILERIGNVPGVAAVTVSRDGNFGGGGRTRTTLTVPGATASAAADLDVFDVPAGPRFFETFGIPLLRGREFAFQDDARAPKVAIINETAARRLFGHQNPIGRRIGVGTAGDTILIGVVQDSKLNSLREETPPVMYRPFLQSGPPGRMTFAIRTVVPPMSMLAAVRRELDAYERNLPLFGFTTVKAVVEKSLAQERLFAALSSLFGLVALALAAVGLYGVMAYSVSQRTREIGLRIALGAQGRSVLALIIGQGMKVVLGGLAAGSIAAFGLTRFIASRLYGITTTDPAVFIAVSALLAFVALLACYLPARRASKVDPMEALRHE